MSLARILVVLAVSAVPLGACSEPPRPTINLYRAIQGGDLDQIRRHIYWGTDINQADPNARNQAGESPLQIALSEGKTQLAGVLLAKGATDDLQKLLFVLVRTGVDDRDSLEFLIERGADVDGKDESGLAPLHIAVLDGARLLAKRLIDLGADVNVADDSGRTPLSIAIESGDGDIIDLLRRSGARAQPAGLAP
jgi:ankyrin repeat protein